MILLPRENAKKDMLSDHCLFK